MKIIKTLFLIGTFLFLGFSRICSAQEELSAQEVIAKSRRTFFYAADDMRAKVLMELINKNGQKRIRELTMLRKDSAEGGNSSFAEASEDMQKYFMYFHQPADVKDTTFMVYKYPG